MLEPHLHRVDEGHEQGRQLQRPLVTLAAEADDAAPELVLVGHLGQDFGLPVSAQFGVIGDQTGLLLEDRRRRPRQRHQLDPRGGGKVDEGHVHALGIRGILGDIHSGQQVEHAGLQPRRRIPAR